jgi:low temperature requirement protein LtrA
MAGRDPEEGGRSATPLELLFDLTFVVAYGTAADELAHALAEDHIGSGILSFAFAAFAITWAWINFSWFASAYDTDDWIYRLTTMLQMVGVLILALGLAPLFESIYEGDDVDNTVMVAGYVVMRVAMVLQWLRAARQDPARRAASLSYVTTILIAQAGWIALALAKTSVAVMFAGAAVLLLVELGGPALAERRTSGTPWHPHHIAERYGLLVIIALGEALLGTMASLTAIFGPEAEGWSLDFALIGLAGVALTFGMWWMYFVIPCGEILARRRERSFGFGYGHIPLFGALVAVGAGLHAAAYYLEGETKLGVTGTVLTVAIPLALYVLALYALYAQLSRTLDPFHLTLVLITGVILAGAVLMAVGGASVAASLMVLAVSPWVTVVGYELHGHRHNAQVLERL